MRIAILVGGLPPIYNGGTEISTIKIAEYAAKAGHDVHVIAADGSNEGQVLYKQLEDNFEIHRVKTIPPHYAHAIFFIPDAIRTLHKIKPDLVHSQAIYVCPSAFIYKQMTGTPYLLYERGGIYRNYFMCIRVRKLLFSGAMRVIAQTEHQKIEILKYVNRDVEVIPNGINVELFNRIDKKEARTKLGFPQDKKIVMSVGRCRVEKNLANFVKVANLKIKDALFVLVGDGDQLKYLKHLALNGNVRFVGNVNNNDVPLYMACADVLVNTSLSEGFPVSILEGLACGLPIVAPDICGIPEIIKNGINGLLTKPNDYLSTAKAIENLLNADDSVINFISKSNKEKARGYTWESVIKKLYY